MSRRPCSHHLEQPIEHQQGFRAPAFRPPTTPLHDRTGPPRPLLDSADAVPNTEPPGAPTTSGALGAARFPPSVKAGRHPWGRGPRRPLQRCPDHEPDHPAGSLGRDRIRTGAGPFATPSVETIAMGVVHRRQRCLPRCRRRSGLPARPCGVGRRRLSDASCGRELGRPRPIPAPAPRPGRHRRASQSGATRRRGPL